MKRWDPAGHWCTRDACQAHCRMITECAKHVCRLWLPKAGSQQLQPSCASSETATLAAMCMMAVERARGGYARV